MSETGGPRRARPPLFLERRSYRRRRLIDAARLLPVLGLMLWLVPLLWGIGGRTVSASGAGIYIFAIWVLLILAAAVFAVTLGRNSEAPRQIDPETAAEEERPPW